jgi:hypothetical protein
MVGANGPMVINLEEKGPTNGVIPKRPRGHKSSKADLKHDAFALSFGEALKGLMAENREKEEALAKRNTKRCQDKEDS